MRCDIELLDSKQGVWFSGHRELPGNYILGLAAARKPAAMKRGLKIAQGAIPHFGGELVKIVRAGGTEVEVDKAVIELALAVVVVECCLGVADKDLIDCHFKLSVYDNGLVHYTRLRSSFEDEMRKSRP